MAIDGPSARATMSLHSKDCRSRISTSRAVWKSEVSVSLSGANTRILAARELVNRSGGVWTGAACPVQSGYADASCRRAGRRPGALTLELAALTSGADFLESSLGSEGHIGGRRAAEIPRAPRVLLAEDDEDFRSLLSLLLRAEGYHVVEAEDGDVLLNHLIDAFAWGADRTLGYDAIITDVLMPGFSGLDVLRAFHRSTASAAVIVMSAFDDARFAQSARALGAIAFFPKPLDTEELLQILAGALDRAPALVRRSPPKKRASQS